MVSTKQQPQKENSNKGKIIQINTVCNTSTGRIMGDIQREAIRQGYETLSLVGRRKPFTDIPCENFGGFFSFWMHVIITTLFDRQGFGSYFVTKRLIQRLRNENPDIIHLHNLHGYYINLPLLFFYLKNEFNGKLFWTFHDCWPFTGHCPHFVVAQCDKWKKECNHCPNKKVYPISLFKDSSRINYVDKKEMFCGLKNLTIITPSDWIKSLVGDSFLGEYSVKVIHNGIDLRIFYPHKNTDFIYGKYGIPSNKKILLGVANIWEERKGLKDLKELALKISKEYQIVLVGMSRYQIRKLQRERFPIIGIPRLANAEDLASLYSVSNIFLNPSMEESFSLVTAEALACGTPAIVLDTSAVKELINADNGIILHEHSANDYLNAIKQLENINPDRERVRESAKKYDKEVFVKRIVELYE